MVHEVEMRYIPLAASRTKKLKRSESHGTLFVASGARRRRTAICCGGQQWLSPGVVGSEHRRTVLRSEGGCVPRTPEELGHAPVERRSAPAKAEAEKRSAFRAV